MTDITAKEVAAKLAADAEGVAKKLLGGGKIKRDELCASSVQGGEGDSLKVKIRGPKAGRWADFASDSDHGDLLDLWAASRGLSIAEAFAEACDYLGIQRTKFAGSQDKRNTVSAPKGAERAQSDSGVMDWLQTERALSPESITAYRVAAHKGAVLLPAFAPDGGSVQYIKYRATKEKKFWSEAGGQPCLFGWQAIPARARTVVICEGELDALAWHSYGYPALSPTNGAGNVQWIDTEFDALARFDTVYLSLDMDEAGQAALPEIIERIGVDRCRIIDLPEKDANDCRIKDVPDADIHAAIRNARSMDPEELIPAQRYADEVVSLFYPESNEDPGVVFPWSKCQQQFTFRPGEVSLIAGVNGHGKSELAGQFTLGAMEQGERCCVASMEFKPSKWLRRLARQATANAQPSESYIRAVHDWYQGKLWVFNATGTAKADRIIEVFRYAVRRYGIRWFVVDNLAKCGFDEDDYNSQKRFVDQLTDFARDFEAHVTLCVHMRKGESEDKPAGKMDVKGTGAITDMVDSVLVIWRNKRKEKSRDAAAQTGEAFDESSDPDAVLSVHKQRNGDYEPRMRLWFCTQSHQYLDYHDKRPRQFVPWSRGAEVHAGGAA